ncbi:MAG: hypothetical protein GTO40_26915 [Deltaproteobacteria bacterium]|nr:hypothetical protein [Deltaproteobacteria bacterium]
MAPEFTPIPTKFPAIRPRFTAVLSHFVPFHPVLFHPVLSPLGGSTVLLSVKSTVTLMGTTVRLAVVLHAPMHPPMKFMAGSILVASNMMGPVI